MISPKAVDDFLLKLLPLSMRGKELGKMAQFVGLPGVRSTLYENVTISELMQGQRRTGVTAAFTKEKCQDRPYSVIRTRQIKEAPARVALGCVMREDEVASLGLIVAGEAAFH